MTGQKLAEAIDMIDEKYIAEAACYHQMPVTEEHAENSEQNINEAEYNVVNEKKSITRFFRFMIPAAACMIFVISVSLLSANHQDSNISPVITSETTESEVITSDISEKSETRVSVVTNAAESTGITSVTSPENYSSTSVLQNITQLSGRVSSAPVTEIPSHTESVNTVSTTEVHTQPNNIHTVPVTERNIQSESITTLTTTETQKLSEITSTEIITQITQPVNEKELTIGILKELSEKGYDISWSDFEKYENYKVSSEQSDGFAVYTYEVDNGKYVLEIGGRKSEPPYYIQLRSTDGKGKSVDVRYESIDDLVYGVKKSRFEFLKKKGETDMRLVYIRADDENPSPEVKKHSFSGEGFTVEEPQNQSTAAWFCIIHDESTGQAFYLNTYTYEAFYAGYDPNFNHELKETEINGHAAALITKGDDPNSLCTLYWNDGCHFAVLMSQLKDYETMRFIAENLETD